MKHRFPIGTTYQTRAKHPVICTVVDHLTTTNSKGDVVSIRYTSTHNFCGQTVVDADVLDTTIARGVVAQIEAAGFRVSGPTDIRAAEHGEPVWVCNARAALAGPAA